MENVNKIQIRLDTINSNATTINIPIGLDFYPVDNTELQQTEFVEKEKEKAVNPIVDHEKYPFYPVGIAPSGNIIDIFSIDYEVKNFTLFDLGLTDDDVTFNRNPFRKTYLRLNFYDSRDTKISRLLARETIHLSAKSDWFINEKLKPLNTIPLIFSSNFQNLFYPSKTGEGYNFYWYKRELPYSLYATMSIMNAKTGKVINLYSTKLSINAPPAISVQVTSNGYNYVKFDFYEDHLKRQKYYYLFNSDNVSDTSVLQGTTSPIDNKIILYLTPY